VNYSRSEVFCDWLDVTCHPESSFADEVINFLAYKLYPVAFSEVYNEAEGYLRIGFSLGQGILVIEKKKSFHRASISGGGIRSLEARGAWRDYVNVLGCVGHKVTRIDAAVDVNRDAPAVLRGLENTYPEDLFSFGRKALRITRLYSARLSDGALTGTWYVGHRSKARVTARVYDKQCEALEKRGETLPPTTRYELTFKKDYNCSLYDALMPESLFYSHASPKLLEAPKGKYIVPWDVKGLVPWKSDVVDYTLTLERFDMRVSSSPELQKLAELASTFGEEGTAIVMRHFEQQLRSCIAEGSLKAETGVIDSIA